MATKKYFCDVCGKLIVECDTDIDYTGVTLICDRCSAFLETILVKKDGNPT